jgi:hypothetical protein
MKKERIDRPVLLCDICDQRIVKAADGNVVSKEPPSGHPDLQDLLYAHQGSCTDAAEKKLGGKTETGFDNLEEHHFRLLYSLGLSPEALLETQKNLQEFGLL